MARFFLTITLVFIMGALIWSKQVLATTPINHLGPGELSDISITSEPAYDFFAINFPTTFYISGQRVDHLTNLSGKVKYYTIDTGSRPKENTIPIIFTKINGVFKQKVTLPSQGCIDLESGNNYLASFCFNNNYVGYSKFGRLYSADTAAPYKYDRGTYIWGQNHSRQQVDYYFSKYIPGVENNKFTVQSLTTGFNKNTHPYFSWVTNQNFAPTNFFWAMQSSLPENSVSQLHLWTKSNNIITCDKQYADFALFDSLTPQADPIRYPVYFVQPYSDCSFTNDYPYIQEPFFNKKYTALIETNRITPTQTPTATPTKTLTPTMTFTPTPSFTPTPTHTPSPSPTNTITPSPTLSLTPSPTVPLLPGDGNNNGRVDGLDYVIWLSNYGTNTTRGAESGDYNIPPDGKVDGIDYVVWLNAYTDYP